MNGMNREQIAAMVEGIWNICEDDKLRNIGDEVEKWAAVSTHNEVRTHINPENSADIVLKNASGAVIATIEVKSGCGTLSNTCDDLNAFHIGHATHFLYAPRFTLDGRHNRKKEAVVVSRVAVEGLMKKHNMVRLVSKGSKRGGGQKIGFVNFLPNNSGSQRWNGLKRGKDFLIDLYAIGESVEEFVNRLSPAPYKGK